MTCVIDREWDLYKKRKSELFLLGIQRGLIKYYEDELLDEVRNIYYGGLPITVMLLHSGMANGNCYNLGRLVTLGFGCDDFRVVYADIDELKLNPMFISKYNNGELDSSYSVHCFAERKTKDGKTWVYDTSSGFVIEKTLYYRMQNPKIRDVKDRRDTVMSLKNELLNCNIEKDKKSLPFILPCLEANLKPIQFFYLDQLKSELSRFKQDVDYDFLCKNINLKK